MAVDKLNKLKVMKETTSVVTPPVFPNSLINEPAQTNPTPNIDGLGLLSNLIGTWTSQKDKVFDQG